MHVKLTLLLTNSMQSKQQIGSNENLKKISLPQLRNSGIKFDVRDDPSPLLYTALSLSLTNHNLSLHPSLQVLRNPNVKKLCASKLEKGGSVCIGNDQDQPFLDADLSELVNGSLSSFFRFCYQDSNAAPTVCGNATDGLFSTDGCPSNAC